MIVPSRDKKRRWVRLWTGEVAAYLNGDRYDVTRFLRSDDVTKLFYGKSALRPLRTDSVGVNACSSDCLFSQAQRRKV